MQIIHYFFTGTIFLLKLPLSCIKYFIIGFFSVISIIPHYIIIGLKYLFNKKEYSKENPDILESKLLPITIITLSLITYLISIFLITRWYVQNERSKNFSNSLINDFENLNTKEETNQQPDQYQELNQNIPQKGSNQSLDTNFLNVNLDYYTNINSETVAWIQVNGTNVSYPVVQHTDNEFYLEHDFYQRATNIGWIFGDYRNDFNTFNNNTILYGHNLVNHTMFGSIPYLLKKNWFNTPNRDYIKLSTKTTNSIWQIFSVYKIEPTTDYLQSKFNSITNYENFLTKITERSSHNFNINVANTDKIITLSTCDNIGTKRVVVHAKLINIESK